MTDERLAPDARLVVIERLLRQVLAAQAAPQVRRYTLRGAAAVLSISLSRLRVKIRRGEVATVRDGGKLFVPRAEVDRLCVPDAPKRRAVGRPHKLRNIEPMTAEEMHRAIRRGR